MPATVRYLWHLWQASSKNGAMRHLVLRCISPIMKIMQKQFAGAQMREWFFGVSKKLHSVENCTDYFSSHHIVLLGPFKVLYWLHRHLTRLKNLCNLAQQMHHVSTTKCIESTIYSITYKLPINRTATMTHVTTICWYKWCFFCTQPIFNMK